MSGFVMSQSRLKSALPVTTVSPLLQSKLSGARLFPTAASSLMQSLLKTSAKEHCLAWCPAPQSQKGQPKDKLGRAQFEMILLVQMPDVSVRINIGTLSALLVGLEMQNRV